MEFITQGNRIAVENFDKGKLYTVLWKNDTQENLMCISIGADCVIFQGEAPINLFTLSMRNADTIDSIEPTQLGTTNYNNLINKPQINGVDLIGNKTGTQLGLVSQSDLEDYATNASVVAGLATKQDALSSSQLAAVNSGITSEDVEQISTNKNNILSTATATMPVYENVALEFESVTGYYDHNTYNYQTYGGQSAATISVQAGEQYIISGKSFYQALRVVFFNANDTVIGGVWSSAGREFYVGTAFTIPENTTKILIQRGNTADWITLKKATTDKRSKTFLYGKKLACIGDSLTERNGKATTNWLQYISEWNGCESINLGIGGTGFARGGDNRYINRITSIPNNADIIGVAVSFNDFAEELPVGDVTDTGTSSMCGYANDFFTALVNQKTSIPIICYVQSPWGDYHYGVTKSDEWITALTTICRSYGIPFYSELYYGGTLKPWRSANRTTYYTPDDSSTIDSVHPNSLGHKTIANALQPHFDTNTN